jgi:hypothetical protein
MSLSPDGKWALVKVLPKVGEVPPKKPYFVLIPTGAGDPRRVVYEDIEESVWADFLSDGREILFMGRRGQDIRFYRGSLEGGKPRPATPPAGGPFAVSSDSRRLLARSNGVPAIFSLDAGPEAPPRPVPGTTAADIPVQWSDDGRSVYLRNSGLSAKVFRVDLETGRRTLWKELIPSDPSGGSFGRIIPTPDGQSYAYGLNRDVSKLYLVEGLK